MAAHGQYGAAIQEWQKGVQEDPSYPGCHEHLGDAAVQAGRGREAEAAYQTAARLDPQNGLLQLKLALVEQRVGNTEMATGAASRAAQLLPDNPEAVGLHGLLEAKKRNYPEAIAALRHAITLRPDDARLCTELASLELDLSDVDGAKRDLAAFLQRHPQDPEACYLMAVAFNQKSGDAADTASALDYARRAIAGMPENTNALALLGQLYLSVNRPVDALRTFQQGLRVAPNNEGILNGLITGFRQVKDLKAASFVAADLHKVSARHQRMEYLKHVLGYRHSNIPAGLELARLELEDDNAKQAEWYYIQLVRVAPQDPRPRTALAEFLKRTGRKALAQQVLRPDVIP